MNKRSFVRSVLAAAAASASLAVAAQSVPTFPSRPIQLIVPFGAGGSTDVVARALAKAAEDELGQPVVVLNKAGAGGAIALSEVQRAKPDGYTLSLFTASGTTVTPFMQKVTYDPLKDFSPVMSFGGYTTYLAVAADSPLKTFEDLTSKIRQNPDKVVIGITTKGAVNHLGAARLMGERQLKVDYVPMNSGAELITALLGGHLEVASISGEIAPQVKAGKLRALVSFTREQFSEMKDVPSIQQNGSNWELDSWLGIAAPAKTPEPIRQRLEAAFMKAAKDPAFLRVMNDMAMIVSVGDGQTLKRKLEETYADNGRVIKELHLGKQ